jgi:hypothetical protein
MDTLKKALLFAKNGVISDYSSTVMERTHAVLATSLVDGLVSAASLSGVSVGTCIVAVRSLLVDS